MQIDFNHDATGLFPLAAQQLINRVGLVFGIPRCPNLAPSLADGRTQQTQRARRNRLRLLNPGAVKVLQRLDTVRRVVLHPLKDNQPAPVAVEDEIALDVKMRQHAELLNLRFDERLHAVPQRFLNLADADGLAVGVKQVRLNNRLGEEMRLTATPPTMRALVASRLQQR